MWCMKRAAAIVLILSGFAWAQDQPATDELNRKYQDALAQLQAAQDRKNELATENEQLKARLADLERQLAEHTRAAADFAHQTWFLRSHYAAWQEFIKRYPRLMAQWRVFLEGNALAAPAHLPDFFDPAPSLSSERWPKETRSR